jgi:hypothetical protein
VYAARAVSIIRAKRTVSAPLRAARPAAAAASPTRPASSARSSAPRQHVLDVPFAMRAVAAAAGARWDADHGVHVWEGAALPAALAPFAAAPYSWERHVERALNGAALPPPSTPTGAIALRAHQTEAVAAIAAARAAGRPGFLLADDVGLGKTITAWAAILGARSSARVLIVCPLAVIAHWRRTIEAMGDGGKDVVVINYDRLGKLFEVSAAARKKVRTKKGLARVGTAPEFDVVVLDESHRCKNPTAARSKLAAKLVAEAGFCLWLSATAGQNPLELSYLAPLLASTGARPPTSRTSSSGASTRASASRRGTYGKWEWRGDRNDCEKVRAMLFEPARVPARRDAPPARGDRRAGRRSTASSRRSSSTVERARSTSSVDRVPPRARARAARPRSQVGAGGDAAAAPEGLAAARAGHGRAGARAARQRPPGRGLGRVHRDARGAARAGQRPRRLPCAVIHGGLGAAAREAERLRFQRGEAKVVLFTVEEGISLHQGEHNEVPRSEVIHDLRWSAIQMAQIEGRCHRDGRFAQVYWAYADDTIEEQLARVVCRPPAGDEGDDRRRRGDAARDRAPCAGKRPWN